MIKHKSKVDSIEPIVSDDKEPSWSLLISRIADGIGSQDAEVRLKAREAATMLRQRLHAIRADQC